MGGYAKPIVKDLLIAKVGLFPVAVAKFFYFYLRWFVVFTIQGKPYGPEEREYLTKKAMGMREIDWHRVPENNKVELIARELWISENMKKFREEQKEQAQGDDREQSAAYKRYLRWKKKKKVYREFLQN
jgi:hypothetical protein